MNNKNQLDSVIIVLGKRLKDDGTPLPELIERVDKAVETHKKYGCKIVATGGIANRKAGISECEVMKRLLLERGVDPSDIIEENKSKTTGQNAKLCKKLFAENPPKRIYLVSSQYHFTRKIFYQAHIPFHKCFKDAEIIPVIA